MSFNNFLETLDNVPPEVERNFNLIRDLDKRASVILEKLKRLLKDYENSERKSQRVAIRKKTSELFEKLISFSEDKIVLATSTYDLIDKNITKLISLGKTPDVGGDNGEAKLPLGYEMPVDPNEPTYCYCHGVSHGEMVGCDNRDCQIEWFHFDCVGLRENPKGKWYCGSCLEELKAKRREMKKKKRKRL